MWRKVDLHRHTGSDAQNAQAVTGEEFVAACLAQALDVVGVTDHDRLERIDSVLEAASGTPLVVVPGVEFSTTRGHILALAPGDSIAVLQELCQRLGARPGSRVEFDALADAVRSGQRTNGARFARSVVLVAAHVDQPGSLLAEQPADRISQLNAAARVHALEVMSSERLTEWARDGVKQSPERFALVQGSDVHGVEGADRHTWLYLPEVDVASLKHAFATPEASIAWGEHPTEPEDWVRSVRFVGGLLDGKRFDFSRRANAIIGPPSVGKSLLIDGLRFALNHPCPVTSVETVSKSRLARQMPDGSAVIVEVEHHGASSAIERRIGGNQTQPTPFLPVTFSQNELTYRALDPTPAVHLLDLHCPDAPRLKQRLADIGVTLSGRLASTLEMAAEWRSTSETLNNAVDGLDATRRAIAEVAGEEQTAARATDLARIESWRAKVQDDVLGWEASLIVPEPPVIAATPALQTDVRLPASVPREALDEIRRQFVQEVHDAGQRFRARTVEALAQFDRVLGELQQSVTRELAVLGVAPDEVISSLRVNRARLIELERLDARRAELDEHIDADLVILKGLVQEAQSAVDELREARGRACGTVNRSMRSFVCRPVRDRYAQNLSSALTDLKTGTYLPDESIPTLRTSLDRARWIECAVRETQGRAPSDSPPAMANQDRVVREAVLRNKAEGIAYVATMWPGDGIDLIERGDGGRVFNDLSDGMKALAIKEISFAASTLPVITDQPEDSVPSTAVFESLVPTLRIQRKDRQFILVSHDANVVVTGDVERVFVLDPSIPDGILVGTLLDPQILSRAIALLEGGDAAFRLRSRRYGEL